MTKKLIQTLGEQRSKSLIGVFLLLILVAVGFFLLRQDNARASNIITICPSGCDYTTLGQALGDPGLGFGDTILFTSDYEYDPVEAINFNIPDGVAIQCEEGAGFFGDAMDIARYFFLGSDTSIEDCHFVHVFIDATNQSNIRIAGNTFSQDAFMQITLTKSQNIEIVDNTDILFLQIQTADDLLVQNNTFKCIYNNSCLNLVVAGIADYNDPDDISNNVDILDNEFVNMVTNTGGDFIILDVGLNVNFIGNTIRSVTLDDNYHTMVSVHNGQMYIAHNVFEFPEKSGASQNGTWGLNIRADQTDLQLLAEHNTFIWTDQQDVANGSTCIGLFDFGVASNITVDITAQYNLCYNASLNTAGNGFSLQWNPSNINVNFSDQYNGIYNVGTLIEDAASIYTSLSNTTVTSNPSFKLDDANPNNDFELAPFSNYLDVNGTIDIGAYSAARGSTFHIDASGVIDYVSVHATDTEPIISNLRTGDTVTYAQGTYSPLDISGNFYLSENIEISGEGEDTVIDATNGGFGIKLDMIDNSIIQSMKVINATETIREYFLTSPTFSTASQDYDFPPFSIFLTTPQCDSTFIQSTTDISNLPGVGTHDIHLVLAHIPEDPPEPELFLTVYVPALFANSISELASNCMVPEFIFEGSAFPIFSLVNHEYIYNEAAVTAAGIFPTGTAPNPTIDTINIEAVGIRLSNAFANTLNDMFVMDSFMGIVFQDGAQENTVMNSQVIGNIEYDVLSKSVFDNTVINSSFDINTVDIENVGNIIVKFLARVFVSGSGNPLDNVDVDIESANSLEQESLMTDATGFTPFVPLTGYVLTNVGIEQGYNPYSVKVTAPTGFRDRTISTQLNSVDQTFMISLFSSSGGSNTALYSFPSNISVETIPGFCTANRNINIRVSASNVSEVALSNDALFLQSQWESYKGLQTDIPWTLSEGSGKKAFYIMFRSHVGNISSVYSLQIFLDEENNCKDMVFDEGDDEMDTDREEEKEVEPVLNAGQFSLKAGDVFKGSASTIYYFGRDGKRHPFPDEGTFFSWFVGFDAVKKVTDYVLSQIQMGRNVTYKPGTLIKTPTQNEVYVVAEQSTVRYIATEAIAKAIFGDDWNQKIRDISDALWVNYQKGNDVLTSIDYIRRFADVRSMDEALGFEGDGKKVIVYDPKERDNDTDDVLKNKDKKITMDTEISQENHCFLDSPFVSTMSSGNISREVRRLQEFLQCLGFFPEDQPSTAIYATVTQEAVAHFQRAHALTVTGVVNAQTREILNTFVK